MRNKKKRSSSGAHCEAPSNERERPMSWEGELSDSEMVIDTSVNNGKQLPGNIDFFFLIAL